MVHILTTLLLMDRFWVGTNLTRLRDEKRATFKYCLEDGGSMWGRNIGTYIAFCMAPTRHVNKIYTWIKWAFRRYKKLKLSGTGLCNRLYQRAIKQTITAGYTTDCTSRLYNRLYQQAIQQTIPAGYKTYYNSRLYNRLYQQAIQQTIPAGYKTDYNSRL